MEELPYTMTRMGLYLAKKSVNKSAISRKTGISNNRLDDICNKDTARLMASEVYLIALAVGEAPGDVLDFVCLGYDLKNPEAE